MFSSLYCMRFLFAFYSANLYNIFMSKNQMINLIAEFGCNHCGSIDLAVKMIDLIASLDVDSKIQTIKFIKNIVSSNVLSQKISLKFQNMHLKKQENLKLN